MNYLIKVLFASLVSVLLMNEVRALEVDREVVPRVTLGGRMISTLDLVDADSAPAREDEVNIRDSLLLLRLDKRIYENGVAGGVIGFEENEDEVQFHQFYAFVWNRDIELIFGRSVLPNTLITFPTPHDADLLRYTHVGNGSSNSEFDQLHARLISLDWYIDHKLQRLNVWAGMRREAPGINAPTNIDSAGVGYQYEQPGELRYVKRLRHAGILLDTQEVSTTGGDEHMVAVIAGAEFNLNQDPSANWSMAFQGIVNNGVDGIGAAELNDAVNATLNQARANSRSLVTALRYASRPNLVTRWQASVALGYKEYPDVSKASEWSILPAIVYRLGQGVDLLAEVIHTEYDDAMFSGGEDNIVQLGIAFSLDTHFNDTIGERNSILNLEHGYIH